MHIFISWSGAQSKAVATVMTTWLQKVIPGVTAWMSERDIAMGRTWFTEIMDGLATSTACVVCLTPESVNSAWVYFEVGGIASKKGDATVFPYLIGVEPKDISHTPIAQFQCAACDKAGTWRLVRNINNALGEAKHAEALLQSHFDTHWKSLKTRVYAVVEELKKTPKPAAVSGDQTSYTPTVEDTAILLKASESDGAVHYVKYDGGFLLQIGGHGLFDTADARTLAKWRESFDRMVRFGLISNRTHGGDMYSLTTAGFNAADTIRKHQAAAKEDDDTETTTP